MPQDPNKLYSIYKTTIWFAVASIILTISLVLMVGQDYGREWKRWQKKFIEFERKKVETDLKKATEAVDPKQLESLQNQLRDARARFNQNKVAYDQVAKEKTALEVEAVKARGRYQDFKQFYDSYKYFLEEARLKNHPKEVKKYEEKIKKLEPNLEQAKQAQDEVEKKLEGLSAQIAAFEAEEKKITKEINKLLKDENLLEKQLKKLKPSAVTELLNAPLIDFVAPSLQIQQVVLEDLHDDFYFAKAQKVDRCTTCHLAIDRKGFEDAPQPFRTHPDLDLFLGSHSAHPLEKIGCTVCHSGGGQSLTFIHAAHMPQNEEQKKEWQKKYHWHELHKWEAKMLPLQHTQASCTKCHQGVMEVPKAPRLNAGRHLAQKYGCFGCHTVKGFSTDVFGGESAWKVGPNLKHIQSKVDREWIIRWLQNPKAFRPSTLMPNIFHLENMSSPEDHVKSAAAIEGIATYLLKHSEPVELKRATKEQGDPEIGKQLVKDLGCLGCHSAEGAKANNHGPELIHMGSKVSREWLFNWLKDPKHYSPDTRMPNLRLSDEEANHITSYLLASKNQKFDETPIPNVEEKDVNAFLLDLLSRKMRHSEAEEEIKKMDLEKKFEFVGKEMIFNQGCFGCHSIAGFEDAKPIGTELTKEGQKEVDKLDFGFIPIERTRQAWFFQKLKKPRIFDRGKIKAYHEKLRMPEFGFTDDEANALTTFLLSLREEEIPLEMKRQLNINEQEIEAGRFLVAKFNCQGCHTLDGTEGRARSLFSAQGGSAAQSGGEDIGNAPPVIDGEGAKVQETWLYHFLQNPTPIRPWLKYRMPTFGFSEKDTNTIIRYFHNLAHQTVSFGPTESSATQESIEGGRNLFIKLKCIQCHQPGESKGMAASFLAPDLLLAKNRLKPNWTVEWIKDPQALQSGTMMPTFFPDGTTPVPDLMEGDTPKQIQAIRDYLFAFTPEEAEQVKAASAPKKKGS